MTDRRTFLASDLATATATATAASLSGCASLLGGRLVVVFKGQQTVDLRNDKFKSGPVALQSAGGTIRFRKVSIKAL